MCLSSTLSYTVAHSRKYESVRWIIRFELIIVNLSQKNMWFVILIIPLFVVGCSSVYELLAVHLLGQQVCCLIVWILCQVEFFGLNFIIYTVYILRYLFYLIYDYFVTSKSAFIPRDVLSCLNQIFTMLNDCS